MCSTHSAYLLCDKIGNTGVVHYLKNIEGAAFPAAPQVNSASGVGAGAEKVSSIFVDVDRKERFRVWL